MLSNFNFQSECDLPFEVLLNKQYSRSNLGKIMFHKNQDN